jgi:D-alanine-D-alanine ligase
VGEKAGYPGLRANAPAMSSKIRIGVLFGGRSAEHEISILSARSIVAGLDPQRYQVIPLAITREGRWLSPGSARAALETGRVEGLQGALSLCPGEGERTLVSSGGGADGVAPEFVGLDVVFPILHGTYGEDGTVQGLLEMAGLPYVGAGVSGSAVGMDKALMKGLLRAAGLPVLPDGVVLRHRLDFEPESVLAEFLETPGVPCFVKPANLGSSVGIRRARTPEELLAALHHAAEFDRKIIVERAVESPRELEIGVIGNEVPEVSVVGEIRHCGPFYDYQTKYFARENPPPQIPAPLTSEETARARNLAAQAWKALDLNGLARVDFLMDSEGRIWISEVNTMPGFTPISMFARLWESSGVPFAELLDRLVGLAFQRFEDRQRNRVRPVE